ncbi:unnamed protein product [Linum trigynum]|uniref:Uncharacterized protein n=1 Tax=Linum trigynum TaxID=586398 RepID=A0AAV2EWL3_9ROSI
MRPSPYSSSALRLRESWLCLSPTVDSKLSLNRETPSPVERLADSRPPVPTPFPPPAEILVRFCSASL